jgi:hypothetical protein
MISRSRDLVVGFGTDKHRERHTEHGIDATKCETAWLGVWPRARGRNISAASFTAHPQLNAIQMSTPRLKFG